MKNIKLIIGSVIIFIATAFIPRDIITWKVKNEYSVKWSDAKNKNMSGSFGGLKATILFDEGHPENSKISALIDSKTVKDGAGKISEPAKQSLGADKFPVITFESTTIKKIKPCEYEATGNITLKGITKEIKFPFHFDSKVTSDKFPFVYKETFIGKFTIASKDFNVTGHGVPQHVTIELTIPVTK